VKGKLGKLINEYDQLETTQIIVGAEADLKLSTFKQNQAGVSVPIM